MLVRGGIEVIVYREAARRPRLIRAFTGHLIALRLAAAALGYALVLFVSILGRTSHDPSLLMIAGLILWPSALVADVGPRARARLTVPALAQAMRACAYALAAWTLVCGAEDLKAAAGCLALAELLAMLVLGGPHVREFGWPWPRFRRRLWAVLLHRGVQATLLRFLRVGLYAADVLVLGWVSATDLGTYAAGRRVVFALLSVGLVAPAALGPVLARAWAQGEGPARDVYQAAHRRILWLALPAACGLTLTSGRVLNTLFGPEFGAGGWLLALLAVRLPWLLLSSLNISALVACRRERQALALVGAMAAGAVVLVPVMAWFGGAVAVGGTLLILEGMGAIGGFGLLQRLGVSGSVTDGLRAPVLGCLAMVPVCLLTDSWPLPLTCGLGAITYLAVWRMQTRPRRLDMEGASE